MYICVLLLKTNLSLHEALHMLPKVWLLENGDTWNNACSGVTNFRLLGQWINNVLTSDNKIKATEFPCIYNYLDDVLLVLLVKRNLLFAIHTSDACELKINNSRQFFIVFKNKKMKWNGRYIPWSPLPTARLQPAYTIHHHFLVVDENNFFSHLFILNPSRASYNKRRV